MANPPHNQENEFLIEDENPGAAAHHEVTHFVDDGGEHQQFNDASVHGEEYKEEFGAFEPQHDDAEIENPISAVSSTPAKNVIIIVIMVIAAAVFFYKIVLKDLLKDDKPKPEPGAEKPITDAVKPTIDDSKPQATMGSVPDPSLPAMENTPPLPPLTQPKADTTITPPPITTTLPSVTPPPIPLLPPDPSKPALPTGNDVVNSLVPPVGQAPQGGLTPEQLQAQKRKSNMLVINGGGTPSQDEKAGKGDVEASAATSVTATKVEDLSRMILQGKMIDAVLETTINTDLPGSLRAVINRDIYAESGKTVLIPRGSRLIGSYDNKIAVGQNRLLVSWARVIRPDGVDINIESSGTDQLGRAGMAGIVDHKYFEIISNSLLASILTVGGTIALDKVNPQGSTTTTTTNGSTGTNGSTSGSSTTTTATPTDTAVMQAAQNLQTTVQDILKGFETNPTIIINQGAVVKVFVNKDLIFPKSTINNVSSGN